jgi:taurine dioxygenase
MHLSARRLTTHIGADLSGIDLRDGLGGGALQAIRDLLVEHHVLFFREQSLDPHELLAAAECLGSIDVHAFGRHLPDLPGVGLIDQTEPERDGANRWHTDSTFMPQPPFGALLLAVKLPAVGGDTSWMSSAAAFDALSPAMQRTFEQLTATHDLRGPLMRAAEGGHSVGEIDNIVAQWPPRAHPVVCRHPETGRKFLYVNSNFTTRINEVNEAESEALLRFLFDHVRAPELQVRFRWEEGSVALWDNRCTQHYAAADYHERRIMHRVTIAGTWTPSAA